MGTHKSGSEIFLEWMAENGIKRADVAHDLHTSVQLLSNWLSGDSSPSWVWRKKIQLYTNGKVKEDDWTTEREREILASTIQHKSKKARAT